MRKYVIYIMLSVVVGLILLIAPAALSCDDIPSAEEQLALYVGSSQKYATFHDFSDALKARGQTEYAILMEFNRIDNNEDGYIDLVEIQADIDGYYANCDVLNNDILEFDLTL